MCRGGHGGGIERNCRRSDSNTELWRISSRGRGFLGMASILLDHEANINWASLDGKTALCAP